MKVYVVWYDNGEAYEDNYQDIEAICSSYEKAVKFIEGCGYKLEPRTKWQNYDIWSDRHIADESDGYMETSYFTIREFEVDKLPDYSDFKKEE